MISIAVAAARTTVPGLGWRRVDWGLVGLAIVALIYAAFIVGHHAPAISEPDDNGYFAQGSLLLQTGHTWFKPESDAQYVGMHWLLLPSGQYVSRYPPGLAALVGALYAVGGYKASMLANPLLSMLALLGSYFLARRVVPTGWALAAAAFLAMNPTFVRHALSGDAHMAVACCLVWGLYFLLRWSQQGRVWQCLAAGFALGCIPTIRYPEAIYAVGIGVFLLWHGRKWPRMGWHYAAAAAGAAIPLVPLLIRNQLLFGAFWRTGYALTNEQRGFGWDFFQNHAIAYVRSLQGDGIGILFVLGLLGMTSMIFIKRMRALGAMLSLLTAPTIVLYMAYYWPEQPMMNGAMTMRFLLPIFPVFALAAVWMLAEMTAAMPRGARIALPLVVIGGQMLLGTGEVFSEAADLHYRKQVLASVTDALDSVARPGDVVMTNPQLLQHLDFVRHWKLADASVLRGGGGGGMGPGRIGRAVSDPDAPSPMQAEKQAAQRALYTGTASERRAKWAADVRAWAGGNKVYIVGTESEVNQAFGAYLKAENIQIVRRVTLPEAPATPQRMGRPGGFAGAPGGQRNGQPGAGPAGPAPGGAGDPMMAGPGMPFMPGGGGRDGPPGFGGPPGGGLGGPPGMGGRPGFAGAGGPGGPMGFGFLAGEKELVIAEVTWPELTSQR